MYNKRSIRNTDEIFLLARAISNPKYAPVIQNQRLQPYKLFFLKNSACFLISDFCQADNKFELFHPDYEFCGHIQD